jgi:hypothetical protein
VTCQNRWWQFVAGHIPTNHNKHNIMSIIGFILMAVGAIAMMVFGIIILIKAFQESIWWGLGYIFVPFVSLVFVIMHWDVCKSPFLRCMMALVVYLIGVAFAWPSLMANAQ